MKTILTPLALFALVFATGCSDSEESPPAPPKEKDWTSLIDEKRAFADLEEFVSIGGMNHARGSTNGIRMAREKIVAKLREAGLKTETQSFKATIPDLGGESSREVNMRNIIGIIPGRRPEAIAIGCHYDTKILDGAEQFVGANDGCSGVALTLELARQMAQSTGQDPPEFTLLFLFFDGEEAIVDWRTPHNGIPDNTYGSRFMADPPKGRKKYPVSCLILLDMIGDAELQLENDLNSHASLTRMFSEESKNFFGVDLFGKSMRVEDDHVAFVNTGMDRAVLLMDFEYGGPANPFWHTTRDTTDKCSATSLARVGSLVLHTLPRVSKWLQGELDK